MNGENVISLDLASGDPSQAARQFALTVFRQYPEHYKTLVREVTRVDRNPTLIPQGRKRSISDEQFAEILNLSATGMSAPRIGELLDIADYNITAALRRHRRQASGRA